MAAGNIEHIGRLAQPRGAPAQLAHQRLPVANAAAEPRGAARQVGVVEVVGLDPHRDELAEQLFQHRDIVVDPAQQHALRQHRDAGVSEPGHRRLDRIGQLARMVGVDYHVDRLLRLQRPHQRGADPARIGHRNPCVEADDLDVLDCGQGLDDRGYAPRRQQEWVAAGDDDLPNLRPLANIGVGAVERRRIEHRALGADLLAAKAVAAIDRA